MSRKLLAKNLSGSTITKTFFVLRFWRDHKMAEDTWCNRKWKPKVGTKVVVWYPDWVFGTVIKTTKSTFMIKTVNQTNTQGGPFYRDRKPLWDTENAYYGNLTARFKEGRGWSVFDGAIYEVSGYDPD
jgi:hypothetical protein